MPINALLPALFTAIAARDRATALRLLTQSPDLARAKLVVGATREDAESFLFTEIHHYAYAGDTALHIAAAAYQQEIAGRLVLLGADVGACNRRGAQPLHYAADGNPESEAWDPDAQFATVVFLISAGANPNADDMSGVAPLHRAVRTRSTAAVRALLANGANAVKKNRNGSTPLHLAVQNTGRGGSGTAASKEQQAEIIRLLLAHGARVSDRDIAGRTVQQCASAESIRVLLGMR